MAKHTQIVLVIMIAVYNDGTGPVLRLPAKGLPIRASFRADAENAADVRFGSLADIRTAKSHVRFTLKSGH